jgi:RNA polymerase sigma-70 factor (ECF subfamily)
MTSEQQAADDAVFEQLFRTYGQPILSYVNRLIGDSLMAEDLTQQVFVKAYRSLPGLPADANQRAWLYRIATNACYDHLRRRRLLQWLPLLERDRPRNTVSDQESVTGERDAVQRALTKLRPTDRAVLILYSVQGYSTVDISEMLDISQGAVKTRLFRARERFREAYAEED